MRLGKVSFAFKKKNHFGFRLDKNGGIRIQARENDSWRWVGVGVRARYRKGIVMAVYPLDY